MHGDFIGLADGFEILKTIILSMILVLAVITILMLVSMLKIFTKAGKPGWAAIVPFYNMYVLAEITWGNGLYFLFNFAGIVPVIGAFITVIYNIITMDKLSKSFGKTTGFTLGLIFLPIIFYPILAFSKDAQYVGAGANRGTTNYNYENGQSQYGEPVVGNTYANNFNPMTGEPINNVQANNFDPMTGAPINNVQATVQPTEPIQNTPVQPVIIPNENGNEPTIESSLAQEPISTPKIVGYDTNTGAPIYDNQQNNMQ